MATHPLRGSLFENLVIMEALKRRFNAGKKSDLSFYRDSSGLEIDLVAGSTAAMRPVEIKSGETVNPDYFANLHKFSKLFPAAGKAGLVYAGDAAGERNGINYFPPQHLRAFLDK